MQNENSFSELFTKLPDSKLFEISESELHKLDARIAALQELQSREIISDEDFHSKTLELNERKQIIETRNAEKEKEHAIKYDLASMPNEIRIASYMMYFLAALYLIEYIFINQFIIVTEYSSSFLTSFSFFKTIFLNIFFGWQIYNGKKWPRYVFAFIITVSLITTIPLIIKFGLTSALFNYINLSIGIIIILILYSRRVNNWYHHGRNLNIYKTLPLDQVN